MNKKEERFNKSKCCDLVKKKKKKKKSKKCYLMKNWKYHFRKTLCNE